MDPGNLNFYKLIAFSKVYLANYFVIEIWKHDTNHSINVYDCSLLLVLV